MTLVMTSVERRAAMDSLLACLKADGNLTQAQREAVWPVVQTARECLVHLSAALDRADHFQAKAARLREALAAVAAACPWCQGTGVRARLDEVARSGPVPCDKCADIRKALGEGGA